MSKKGQSYNSPGKRMPAPADLRALGNGTIIDLLRKEWLKRLEGMNSGRASGERSKARAGQKYRNKGKKR